MAPFKYRKELFLTEKVESKNQATEYFEKLKTYFALVSGNNFKYDDDAMTIEIGSNYFSPPIRFFGSIIPAGKKYIFFNTKVNVLSEGKTIKVVYVFNYAIAVLLYLLWMLGSFILVYTQSPSKENIHIPILFFGTFETLIFTIGPILLTMTFKKNIAKLFSLSSIE